MLRLQPGLEVFPDGDTVYLIRDGTTAEFVIEGADAALIALLDRLREPCDPAPSPELDELRAHGLVVEAVPEAPLDPESQARYGRQLRYFAATRPGHAAAAQRALASATVTIVGTGGLGTWTASALACAGLGRLVLVDDDTIELGNLNRQILYRRADVGRPKVEVADEALTAFNPAITIVPRRRRVDGPAAAAEIVEGADFVVETADWPPYELSRWLDAACRRHRIPRITAAQFPPYVRIGPAYLPGRPGCLECQERAARRAFPLYDRLQAHRRDRPETAATLGPASGIIGAALAMEVTHHLTGIATPATAGAGITIDLRDWSVQRDAIERDPGCRSCGA